MSPLTKKQKKVLNFILDFSYDKNKAPTLRDITENFSFKYTSTAQFYVNKLVDKGYLTKYRGAVALIGQMKHEVAKSKYI